MATIIKNVKIQKILEKTTKDLVIHKTIREGDRYMQENEKPFSILRFSINYKKIIPSGVVTNFQRINKVITGIIKLLGMETRRVETFGPAYIPLIDRNIKINLREDSIKYMKFTEDFKRKIMNKFLDYFKSLGIEKEDVDFGNYWFLTYDPTLGDFYLNSILEIYKPKDKIEEKLSNFEKDNQETFKIILEEMKKYILQKINLYNAIIEGKEPLVSFSILNRMNYKVKNKELTYNIYFDKSFADLAYKKLTEKDEEKFIKFNIEIKKNFNENVNEEIFNFLNNTIIEKLNESIVIGNYKTGNLSVKNIDINGSFIASSLVLVFKLHEKIFNSEY
jgi:hypothetical protein